MAISNSTRNCTGRAVTSMTGVLLIALSSIAFAGNPPTAPLKRAPLPYDFAPTKEMREKMALLHEQMAACLRSKKSISECRAEMQKNCHDMMGDQGTMMMSMGGAMIGHRMHRGMMSTTPSSSSPPK
jgi:hypothetical protein